ncbi:MAG: inositol 2-dehydrogenase [Clostridia bacterium]|nr:inositol 2-dehydrogenase [Clostridia bacterium]
MKEVRIGQLGLGRIGRLHATNLCQSIPGAKLVAVADPYLNDDGIAFLKSLGVERWGKDEEEIFAAKDIDAVLICSPTGTHPDFIRRAAAAGKHIFCEKPVGLDIPDIESALDAVKKAGVKLQLGFVRRFDHNHKKVRDVVASGRLGAPHVVKVCSRDPEQPPEAYVAVSGGIFVDMMIHDFDMARYLSGSEVTEVVAYGTNKIDPFFAKYDDVDTAIVMLKFENGAIGVIDNSRAARYGYDQRVEVHCDKGCVQDGNDLIDMSMISTADGVVCEKPTWFFLERYNNAFIAEVKDFINAVANDAPVPVDGHDGLMAVKIAIAAKESLKENRPVKVV